MKRLTTKEVAEQFGVHPDTLRKMIADGTLADIVDISIGSSGRRTFLFYQEKINAHMGGKLCVK